ncbi:hypothetical protein DFH08DRAFT_971213 [Mycena albidolilacea]|uniref:Uncharacterized protein n=1 Tax=Mycena albidolilacea TaxID=1033008 RepID=A0AAD7EFG1_9AGAR|nr:hypothetical protein DFH08DRAFT_971213 [Mycena albidolilacea]
MTQTRSSTRNAATAPATNTRSGRRTAASRSPTRNAQANLSRKQRSRKQRSTKKTAPREAAAPTEALEAVPSDDEPEGNEKVIDTASTEVLAVHIDDAPEDKEDITDTASAGNDEPEANETVIDTASAKVPEAVPGDEPENDEETVDSDTDGGESTLPPSSPPLASSSPLASPPAPVSPPTPTRPLPRRLLRSTTVPRPATGDVNDNMFSLGHRWLRRRRSVSSQPQPSSDGLWKSVGSEPQLNSDNLDESGVDRQGERGLPDDDDCTNADDAHIGDGEAFGDYESPPPRRTRPSLSARPSRSLSPASPSKPLGCGISRSRSITVGPVSPGAISRRSRSRTLSNAREPSPLRAVSRGRSRSHRTNRTSKSYSGAISRRSRSRALSKAREPSPPRAVSCGRSRSPRISKLSPIGAMPHPPARGPPPPLPPAHTKPPPPLPPAHTKPPPPLPPAHNIPPAPAPDSPRGSPIRTRNGGHQVRPPPERSPSPSRDLSSDDSTDEYGRTQEAKRRLEAARAARGYSPAAISNAGDEDDMQDYLAEVAVHGFSEDDAGGKPTKNSKARAMVATNGKVKGRAAPAPAPDPESTDPNPDEVVEEDLMGRGYSPGPVPRQILEQLHALEEEYDGKVAALAASCNKDPATLRRATTPHELRSTSAWNMYLSHHAVHHPKRPGTPTAQYNIDARRAFEALLPGLSKAEMGKTSLVLERLPWLQYWWKELNTNHVENLRTKGQFRVQAKKAAGPLIQMAKQLSNTWGIHIFAVAIDPRGGDSFAFAGSREMEQVRLADGSSISGFMGDLETKIRMIQMEERGEDTSRLYVPRRPRNSNQTMKKAKRDVYRSNFGMIMGDRLAEICFKVGLFTAEQVKNPTMVWNEKFLDLVFRGKFRIINYPLALENIGQVIGAEQFNTKAVNVKEYDSFMPALERAANQETGEDPEGKPVIRIVAWDPEERDQQLEDQEEVPLVVSTDGRSLRLVQHSPLYVASVAEAARRRTERRAEKRKAEGGKLPVPHRPLGHVPRLARLNPQTSHWPLSHGFQSPLANQVYNRRQTRSQGRALRDVTTERESALARRLQLSPAAASPGEPPLKRRRTDDNERNTMAQTHAGNRKRKRSPDSPGHRDAVQDPSPIAIRLAIGNDRSEIFYATKFQPASHARSQDSHTYYFNTNEGKWRQMPHGMEPVITSQEDREKALSAKKLLGLVD